MDYYDISVRPDLRRSNPNSYPNLPNHLKEPNDLNQHNDPNHLNDLNQLFYYIEQWRL